MSECLYVHACVNIAMCVYVIVWYTYVFVYVGVSIRWIFYSK